MRWWAWFSVSFLILLANYLSIIVTGDRIAASDFRLAQPQEFSALNILLCAVSAVVGAFIIAATFGATPPVYSGYLNLQKSKKCLLVALCLPSVWLLLGLLIANIQQQESTDVFGGLEWITWVFYRTELTRLKGLERAVTGKHLVKSIN